MFGAILRKLLDRKLTTSKELQDLTGRGASTIYRWSQGESKPDYSDMHKLIRGLSNPQASRAVLDLFTCDLPVVVHWLDEDREAELPSSAGADDPLDLTMIAMECLIDVLVREREAMPSGRLSEEAYAKILDSIDCVIRYMTASKNMLASRVVTRKRARRIG